MHRLWLSSGHLAYSDRCFAGRDCRCYMCCPCPSPYGTVSVYGAVMPTALAHPSCHFMVPHPTGALGDPSPVSLWCHARLWCHGTHGPCPSQPSVYGTASRYNVAVPLDTTCMCQRDGCPGPCPCLGGHEAPSNCDGCSLCPCSNLQAGDLESAGKGGGWPALPRHRPPPPSPPRLAGCGRGGEAGGCLGVECRGALRGSSMPHCCSGDAYCGHQPSMGPLAAWVHPWGCHTVPSHRTMSTAGLSSPPVSPSCFAGHPSCCFPMPFLPSHPWPHLCCPLGLWSAMAVWRRDPTPHGLLPLSGHPCASW